jgi:mRNA interferase MazF
MITSATHQRWSDDIAVSDLLMAGLPAASIVRVAKIATIEAREAERIGCLSVADRPAVRAQIAVLLTDALGEQA